MFLRLFYGVAVEEVAFGAEEVAVAGILRGEGVDILVSEEDLHLISFHNLRLGIGDKNKKCIVVFLYSVH